MKKQNEFYKTVLKIALPVTLQSLLQSSFSVVDQLMIGKLGTVSIAGVGYAAKFASIYSVILGAISAVAGIMISQYIGQRDDKEVNRSFFVNLMLAGVIAFIFIGMSLVFSDRIMGIYTNDRLTIDVASKYIRIISATYLPMAVSIIASTLLRCMNGAVFPFYASIIAAVINTVLNYLLIFGKAGFPQMGVEGAAIATVVSQFVVCILTLIFMVIHNRKQNMKMEFIWRFSEKRRVQYLHILCPILICEFLWSLGENVYTAIYGNIGTQSGAAMTLTIPIQSLMIGALSGISQAAGIIIGKSLGSKEYDKAYDESKKLMRYGFYGSMVLSVLLIILGRFYVQFYQVETEVMEIAYWILVAFALISPVKVQNMILGGGIIRSGGKTKYIMCIDFIGTWLLGVPLGLLSAFVFKLPIQYVYFILSLEEVARFVISVFVFKKRIWMKSLD